MSDDPRMSHYTEAITGQDIVGAHGTDKHGGYHDYLATNDADAKAGLEAEVAEANEDDD